MKPADKARRLSKSNVVALLLVLAFPVASLLPLPGAYSVRIMQCGYAAAALGWIVLIGQCCGDRRWTPLIGNAPPSLSWILLAALAARIPLLAATPSDDVYRYVWEGMVRLEGVNPYVVPPDAESLEPLRPSWFTTINHPEHAAIYPPTAQALFVALAAIAPNPLLFKSTFVFADILTILVLARWLRRKTGRPHMAVLYALCPATLSAFAREAHLDSVMLLGLALFLDRCDRDEPGRWTARDAGIAAAGLGLAIGIKWIAVLLAPWFLVRLLTPRPRAASHLVPVLVALLVSTGIVLLPALAYLDHGWKTLIGPLRYFSSQFHSLDLARQLLLEWFDPQTVRCGSVVVILAACALVAALRVSGTLAAAWTLGLLILLSPTIHPWYATWLLPALVVRPIWPWLVLPLTMAFAYEGEHLRESTGDWRQPEWVMYAVFLPFYAAWLFFAVGSLRSKLSSSA